MVKGIGQFIIGDNMEVSQVIRDREEFFRTCTSVECKRKMLGPFVSYFSKEEIEGVGAQPDSFDPAAGNLTQGYSAAVLYRKLLQRLRQKSKRTAMAEPFIEPWSGEAASLPRTIDELIDQVLESAGVKNTACLKPEVVAELRCYALFTIVDPALAARASIKLLEIAGLAARSVRGMRAASGLTKIADDVPTPVPLPINSRQTRAEGIVGAKLSKVVDDVPTPAPTLEELSALAKSNEGATAKYVLGEALDANSEFGRLYFGLQTVKDFDVRLAFKSILDFMGNNIITRQQVIALFQEAVASGGSAAELASKLKTLTQAARERFISAAAMEMNTPMRVPQFLNSVLLRNPTLQSKALAVAKKGGAEAEEAIYVAAKKGQFERALQILDGYDAKTPSSLNSVRNQLAALRTELSPPPARVSLSATARSSVAGARRLETQGYAGNSKVLRASAADVIEVRERFPAIGQNIDQAFNRISDQQLLSRVDSVAKIPDGSSMLDLVLVKRLQDGDPRIQNTVLGIWNRMNDPEAMARYTRSLAEDAAVDMLKNGSQRELDALARGELTRNSVMRVLVHRHRALGNSDFSTITGPPQPLRPSTKVRKSNSNGDFRTAVGQGPFFDKPFGGERHGIDAHFLQKDYVADVVQNTMRGEPQAFWDYLGSKQGIRYWVPLFDSFTTSAPTFARPEVLSHQLSGLLQITD
jgi:hypothetical protein